MIRKASAEWNGTGKDGSGSLSSTSGVLSHTPYSFATRFTSEDGKLGTNPEELIAAAHAGCYSMALSFQLTGAGFTPTKLSTSAALTMENVDGHFEIKGIYLNLTADVPGISNEQFQTIADNAKKTCPVSKALEAIAITLTATLN
jgi:osmotically inducible protein OsmC